MKKAAKAALAFSTGIAEIDGFSSDMLVVDQNKEAIGSFSAKARLSTAIAKTGNENIFQRTFCSLCLS